MRETLVCSVGTARALAIAMAAASCGGVPSSHDPAEAPVPKPAPSQEPQMKVDPAGTELFASPMPIYEIHATGSAVLWRACGAEGCVLRRRAHASAKVDMLLEGQPIAAFAVHGGDVFVATAGSILRLDAGGPTTIATGEPQLRSVAVDETHVYWSNAGTRNLEGGRGTTGGTIVRAPRDGGPRSVLATHGSNARRIAVDTTSVYWTADAGIDAVPKSGGEITSVVASPSKPPASVATDGDRIFFTGEGAASIRPGDPTPQTLFEAPIVLDVVPFGARAYVTRNFVFARGEKVEDAGVFAVEGGRSRELAALRGPTALAVDSTAVYVADGPPLSQPGDHRLIAFPHP